MIKLSELLLYGIPGLLVAIFVINVLREIAKDPGAALSETLEGVAVLAFWAAVVGGIWLLFATGVIEWG
jgi:hypothetical protein